MIIRAAYLFYGVGAYALALASITYLVGFLASAGVPKGINDGTLSSPWLAVAIDATLITLFGLHHSVTARKWFKAKWIRIIPPALERSTYLYMTSAIVALLVLLWRPIPITLWQVENTVGVTTLTVIYMATWCMMFGATFHFGHFSFFGLRQILNRISDTNLNKTSFAARYLYSLVRHPISLGWMLTPWITPHMTVGLLVWAVCVACYVLIATRFEEADLVEELGEDYVNYRTAVPAFIPGTKSPRKPESSNSGIDPDSGVQ